MSKVHPSKYMKMKEGHSMNTKRPKLPKNRMLPARLMPLCILRAR